MEKKNFFWSMYEIKANIFPAKIGPAHRNTGMEDEREDTGLDNLLC